MGFLRKLFGVTNTAQDETVQPSERRTQPLSAEKLAQALSGEGRRHVVVGNARITQSPEDDPHDSLAFLLGNSDGLNVLPDFAVFGVSETRNSSTGSRHGSHFLKSYTSGAIQRAILDLLALDSDGDHLPLQDAVGAAVEQALIPFSAGEVSLTSGLLFAEILILAQLGNCRAYLLDNHHIEHIQPLEIQNSDSQIDPGKSAQVFSRPIIRDGYLLLATPEIWSKLPVEVIHQVVLARIDPQDACEALLREAQANQARRGAVLTIYFPPDFGPWR
jgi:hypothetical protein